MTTNKTLEINGVNFETLEVSSHTGQAKTGYENLIDIRTVKLKEKSSRRENAMFFLEQIKDHRNFRVDMDIVEIRFIDTDRTLSDALASYLQQKSRG